MSSLAGRSSGALNCIIDHSALIAGLSTRGRNNLDQWVRIGAVNLFIPLETVEKLKSFRNYPPPLNRKAAETLSWLDRITSVTESRRSGRVVLQGPEDQYETWEEVESYLLPDTPLSSRNMNNVDGIMDSLDNMRLNGTARGFSKASTVSSSFSSAGSGTPPISPTLNATDSPEAGHSRNVSHDSAIAGTGSNDENAMKDLLNFVVWRSHHEDPTLADSGRYILLTNDSLTQKQAQKFGVRAKLLAQVESIVSRDAFKGFSKQMNGFKPPVTGEIDENEMPNDEDEEDRIVFNPAQRPGSSRKNKPAQNLWDPDNFDRSQQEQTFPPPAPVVAERTPQATNARASNRGNLTPRATAGPMANRGGHPRSSRGQPFYGSRGAVNGGRGRIKLYYGEPIDPDSYVRPRPASNRGRGKLWDPNT